MSKTTHNFGETPEAEITEALPHKYDMGLIKSDMLNLLRVLALDDQEWGIEFRISILSTLGIEEI